MKSPKKHTRSPKKIKSRKLPKNEFPTLKQLLAYYYYQKETKNFQGDVFLVMATDLVSNMTNCPIYTRQNSPNRFLAHPGTLKGSHPKRKSRTAMDIFCTEGGGA